MKLGFLQVYNEAPWIGFAIDQAMMLCDELLICEGSQFTTYPDIPERSNDGTLDIIADKKKQYSGQIKVMDTVRIYGVYKRNQCTNFNIALNHCKVGDYFLPIDADSYIMNNCISWVNNLMAQEAFDVLSLKERLFTYSFYWEMLIKVDPIFYTVAYRKTPEFKFIPAHRAVNIGEKVVESNEQILFHYTWIKSRSRVEIRFRTSKRYREMEKMFNQSWDNLELIDGKAYKCWPGRILTLKRYDGEHPEILNSHPWRYIEDIRKEA